MSSRRARLLVAEGQTLLREALVAAFEVEADLEVVGEADSGPRAVEQAERTRPDLVILDAALPPGDWRDVCTALKSAGAGLRVVVRQHRRDQDTLLAAVQAGVDGYVSGEMDLPRLIDAVRQVREGHTYVPPPMLGELLNALLARNRENDRVLRSFLNLSRREREVLELLVDGSGPEAVASILAISPQTARTHIQNIIEKLGVHSRLEVVALAVTHDVLERLH